MKVILYNSDYYVTQKDSCGRQNFDPGIQYILSVLKAEHLFYSSLILRKSNFANTNVYIKLITTNTDHCPS